VRLPSCSYFGHPPENIKAHLNTRLARAAMAQKQEKYHEVASKTDFLRNFARF
jgi:hypothetical protein